VSVSAVKILEMKNARVFGFFSFDFCNSAIGQKNELAQFRFGSGLCSYNLKLDNLTTHKTAFPEWYAMILLPNGSLQLNYLVQ